MKKYLLFLLLIPVYFLSSCEDVVDVDIKPGKEALVVEGWITNLPEAQYVKLYKTIPYFENPEYPAVKNALVVLSDDAGNIDTLKETEAGKYEIKDMKAVTGRNYRLSIQTDFGSYEANTQAQRLSWHLDSATYEFKKKSAMIEKEGYYPGLYGQELAGQGDFIMLRMKKNGQPLQTSQDINLFEDKFVDGNYIHNAEPQVKDPFQKDDQISYEMWSLTEDAFHFWTDLRSQLRNGKLFAVPASNTRTNVVKKTPASLDVAGYFGASMVGQLSSTVR